MYGVPIPATYYYTLSDLEEPQMSTQDNTPMKKNICYAPTLVSDERYSYVRSSYVNNTEYSVVCESPNDDV